jgi:chemosensory pili system protein ChpA (sensor histidine kinase/response regulator)
LISETHVLVVEDDVDIAGLIRTILLGEGYDVTVAHDGLEALNVLRAGLVPCLILLDLEMPVMSGRELKAELSADSRFKDIPLAVMSASRENLKAFHGALRKLKKPFNFKELIRAVGEHCSTA